MSDTVTVLGMSGSLRKGSTNTAALRAAGELLPEGMTLETVGLGNLPHYDDDVRLKGYPPEVQHFRDRIKAADAILFVTPEYNYSIPGVLKNAIDWASRPYGDSAWNDKPVAVMGASVGPQGTSRAQYHLRQIFVFLNMHAISHPEVMVGNASQRFDENGNLVDETSKAYVVKSLKRLVQWAHQLQTGREAHPNP